MANQHHCVAPMSATCGMVASMICMALARPEAGSSLEVDSSREAGMPVDSRRAADMRVHSRKAADTQADNWMAADNQADNWTAGMWIGPERESRRGCIGPQEKAKIGA